MLTVGGAVPVRVARGVSAEKDVSYKVNHIIDANLARAVCITYVDRVGRWPSQKDVVHLENDIVDVNGPAVISVSASSYRYHRRITAGAVFSNHQIYIFR